MHSNKLLLTAVFLLIGIKSLFSGIEPVNHRISGASLNGGAVYVVDNKWPAVNSTGNYVTASAYSKITFGVDERVLTLVGAHKTSIDISVTWRDASGVATTVNNLILTVDYDPAKSNNTFTYENTYAIKGAHQVVVIVNKVYDANNVAATALSAAAIPVNLFLEAEQVSERYYSFPQNYIAQTSSTYLVNHTYLSASNELEINWKQVPGAEEYDLEWGYINDYTSSNGVYATNTMEFAFKNNATRIRTGNLKYRISLNYEHGYIFYRVRGVGRSLSGASPNYVISDITGDWSATDNASAPFTRTLAGWLGMSFGSNIHFNYQVTNIFDENKNQQYSASFAEEGKKKEVISYFDGSLHNRQTITKSNSDKQVIVGETFYDHQGRPAVTALPVPSYNASTGAPDEQLKYYEEFNLSDVNTYPSTTTPAQFSRADFDVDVTGNCPSPSTGMKTDNGASRYYSSNNPDKEGSQAYVPDAEKYPFTQTAYTPDNTGRVRKQSGLGKEFNIGSGHETTTLYSTPLQQDLDELFGSEAGNADRYKKNTVIDANGQISVSYMNKDGKVVATALAGNSPQSMSTVGNGAVLKNQTFLSAADQNYNSINKFDGSSIIFNWPIVPNVTGTYTFSYDLTVPKFNDNCFGFCYDCDYFLELTVKDECGVPVYATSPSVIPITGSIHSDCSSANIVFNSSTGASPAFQAYLTSGKQYYLEKKLTINPAQMDVYLAHYSSISNNPCIKDENYFKSQAELDMDATDCNMDCATCSTKVATFMAQHDNAAMAADPDYLYISPADAQVLYDKCNEACKPVSKCETQFTFMLNDMAPGGQYGQFTAAGNYDANAYPLSVYNLNNSLPQGASNISTPPLMFNSYIITLFSNYFPSIGNQFINCFAGLPANQLAGWRSPNFYSTSARAFTSISPAPSGSDYYHYYDDATGTSLSKIYLVETAPGVYTPEPLLASTIKTDANNAKYIYPDELKYLKDFINNYKPTWSRSLVKNHPEWCYFKWCEDEGIVHPTETYSSEGFDNYLRSIDTYDVATDPMVTAITGLSSANVLTDIVNKDPYFNTGAGAGTISGNVNSAYLKDMMIYRLSNFMADPNIINISQNAKQAANNLARYATMYGNTGAMPYCFLDNTPSSFPVPVTASEQEMILNKEWTSYRDFYLALKGEVQAIGAHINAINRNDSYHCGCFNGCIGNTGFDAFNPGNGAYDGFVDLATFMYTSSSFSFYGTSLNGGYLQNAQPCNSDKKTLYASKQRRFIYSKDLVASTGASGASPYEIGQSMQQNGEYQAYLKTGQCPTAIKLQTFLNDMSRSSFFDVATPDINLYLHPSFDDSLYTFVRGATGNYIDYTLQKTFLGNTCTLDFVDGSNPSSCSMVLTYPGSGTPLWEKIVMFNGIQFTSPSAFNVYAFVDHDNLPNTPAIQVILGGTSSCFNSTCSYPSVFCTPNQTGKDFVTLLNNVYASIKLNGNPPGIFGPSYNLMDPNSPESVLFTGPLVNSLGITGSSPNEYLDNISFNGNDFGFTLTDANNPSMKSDIDIAYTGNLPFPPQYVNNIAYFGNLVPDANDPCKFSITAYWYFNNTTLASNTFSTAYSFTLQGTIRNHCFKLGDCAAPVPQTCNTPGYNTMLDFGKFINELKTIQPGGVTTPYNLGSMNYFTTSLKAVINADPSTHVRSFNNTTSGVEMVIESGAGNNCSIALDFPPGVNWGNINSFQSFTSDNTNFGVFSCQVTYNQSYTAMITGTTCYAFANCDDCTQTSTVIFSEDFDRFKSSSPPTAADYTYSGDVIFYTYAVQDYEYEKSPSLLGSGNTLGTMTSAGYYDFYHSTITHDNFVGIGPSTTSSPSQHTPPNLSTSPGTPPNMMEVFMHSPTSDRIAIPYQKTIPVTPGKGYRISVWFNEDVNVHDIYLSVRANNTMLSQVMLASAASGTWKKLSGVYFGNTGTTMNVQVVLRGTNYAGVGNVLLDDITVEEFGCVKDPIGPATVYTPVDECLQQLTDISAHNGLVNYQYYTDSVAQSFKTRYINKCKQSLEHLYGSFTDNVSQYTLYYYDQAGNLIKTVPPEGVTPVTAGADFTAIQNDRLNNTQSFYTSHTMASNYEYNSLNQLVTQKMPDHESTGSFNITPLVPANSGLPSAVTGNGLGFYANGNNGLLVGENGTAGAMYATADGGKTWLPATIAGAGEIKNIQQAGTSNVFAVSSAGNLLRSQDNGVTWKIYNLSGGSGLNALAFFEDPNAAGQFIGLAGGDNSQVYFCKFPASGNPVFNQVAMPNNVTTNVNVIRQVYYSGTTPPLNVFVLGGSNGVLLHSYNAASIAASSNYYTNSPQLSALNTPFNANMTFNDLDLVLDGTPKVSGFAVGKDPSNNNAGFAGYVELGLTASMNNVLKNVVFTAAPDEIKSIARRPANTSSLLDDDINLGGANGHVYYTTYQPSPANTALATLNTGIPAGVTINHVEYADKSASASPADVYAFGSDGKVYKSATVNGAFSMVMNPGVALNSASIKQSYSSSNPIFMAAAQANIYKATPSAGFGDLANCISLTANPFNDVSIASDNSGAAFACGNNGTLIESDAIGGGWSLISSSGANFRSVCALAADNAVVAGNSGNVLYYNGTSLTSVTGSPFSISGNFNRVYFKNSQNGFLVGDNAKVYVTTTGPNGFALSGGTFSGSLKDIHFFSSTGFIVGSGTTMYKSTDNGSTWTSMTAPASPLNRVYVQDQNTIFAFGNSGQAYRSDNGGTTWVTLPTGASTSSFKAIAFNSNAAQIITAGGGTNNSFLINSQQGASPTRFLYDQLGRLVISQNGKQRNKPTQAYSYTVYDALGRITQVGEAATANDPFLLANYNSVIDFATYTTWLGGSTKTEVTTTVYDVSAGVGFFTQTNLRKRVSATYIDTDGNLGNGYTAFTVYSYDVHGNVKSVLQGDNSFYASYGIATVKIIDYKYDLISGKINEIVYQDGKPDELRHKYEYDADNRITNVLTSNNGGITWQQDAKYFYYRHGPLARTEIGNNKTQGIDYAYTLQGWIKGVNAANLNGANDIGKDAITGTTFMSTQSNLHQLVGNDGYAYNLNYYSSSLKKDYTAIDASKYAYGTTSFDGDLTAVIGSGVSNALYNGNINAMQTTIAYVGTGANQNIYTPRPQLSAYSYDQLNRIKEMRTYSDFVNNTVSSNNNYATPTGAATAYKNTFNYDGNGNIESQKRYSDAGVLLDDLTYHYDVNGAKKRSNKLYHVNDAGTTAPGDINDQGTFSSASINTTNNYSYDEIGNLVKDKAEEINNITWTVYGKIKTIERLSSSTKPDLEFIYNSSGQRIEKIVKPKASAGILVSTSNFITTYYVRDTQGNTMATYEGTAGALKLVEQDIFGSSRLGTRDINLSFSALPAVYARTEATGTIHNLKSTNGSVNYELQNHLGNVLTVVSDRKLPVDANSDGIIERFVPDVRVTNDYYAFGALMPGRQYNSGNYKYGFNGKANDDEVKGSGNQQDYGMRIYDPRLGRFLSVDPIGKNFPWNSPYAFAENDPISCIDLDGLEKFKITDGTISTFDPATGERTEHQVKNLLLVDTKAKFEVIDEDGVSSQSFKYQEFACQMADFNVVTNTPGRDGEGSLLVTPNKLGDKTNTPSTFKISTDDATMASFNPLGISATTEKPTGTENWSEPIINASTLFKENNPNNNAVRITNGSKNVNTEDIIKNLKENNIIQKNTQIEVVPGKTDNVQIELGNYNCEE